MAIYWIVLLITILPFWFLQNILHESAHGVAMRLGWGWKFSIWPFPSTKLGRFTFACVIYEPTSTAKMPSPKGRGIVSIMPKIMNWIFLTIMVPLSIVLRTISPIAAALCALFGVCNLIDFSVGMAGIFRKEPNQSDIWKFQSYIEIDVSKLRWISAVMIFIGWVVLAIPTYLLFRI